MAIERGLILAAMLCIAGPALAQTTEGRMSGLQISGDEPIQIESDRLEVRENENMAIFSGNVSVVQGPTLMRAGTMTVYYARDAQGGGSAAAGASAGIDRLEIEGKVYVKSDNQVATGDRASVDMVNEVLVMSGSEVVLSEGENVIVGCKLTVQMGSGRAQLEGCAGAGGSGGRVRMLLQPGSQERQ